jgi:PAS domain S-box-containing protein
LKINVPDLLGACHEVIETLASKEREVQDSESRTYSMWIRPYRTADNHIDGVVLSLFDITERKQATEARYRRMFEAARDGIIIIHAENGEILDFNPIITKRFGYTRPILLGQRLWDTDLFRTASMDASILSEVQNEDSVQRSIPLLTAAGEPVDVEVAANLYTEGERRVVQFNIRDVSARKRVEEKLRRADDEIRQSQKMEAVGRLAGGVAHDFNNLLTAVLGYSDFLRQTLEEDHPGRRLLDQITKAGERAVILTKQLLAFGRKHIVHRTVLNPNEVLEEIRQLLSVMTRENVELNILQHPGVGNVVADRSQLEQVVLNLALNARDSMPNGGRITIEAGNLDLDDGFSELHPTIPAGRYVVISVKDTGTGMTEETQSHIFEPFYTTKPSGSGVGLGLSTVYAIVTQNGGHIRATSELGVGSNFMVYLPRVQEDVTGTGETVHLLTPSGSETILLVEDEPPVRQITCMFLESLGYRVLEAACGPDALRLSREYQGRIDLLLTDVVMPQMSGREVAFQLSNERPGMRVLYMSGHTENVISHHGVLTEGVAFLQKPFTQHALAAKVRESLDRGK